MTRDDWNAAAPGMFWLLVIGAALFVFGKAPSKKRKRRRRSTKTTRSRPSSSSYKVIATGSQAKARKIAAERGGRVAHIGSSWMVVKK